MHVDCPRLNVGRCFPNYLEQQIAGLDSSLSLRQKEQKLELRRRQPQQRLPARVERAQVGDGQEAEWVVVDLRERPPLEGDVGLACDAGRRTGRSGC